MMTASGCGHVAVELIDVAVGGGERMNEGGGLSTHSGLDPSWLTQVLTAKGAEIAST
jgi:hypothetical protein